MTPAARVAASVDLLDQVLRSPRPADGVVSAYFRGKRYIGSKDRVAVAERLYAALRHHARLGWWLDRVGHSDGARSRLIAELTLAEGLPPDNVGRLFADGRYADGALSAFERRLAERLGGQALDHPDMPGPVRAECPDWAAEPLRRAFPDSFEAELLALLEPAPLNLRVNVLKANRDDVLTELEKMGVAASATPLSPLGLRVEGRPPLAGSPLFRSGAIEVQDEGSQLVALLVDARPGQQVADFCAGAGGKALALAAAMANKGRVVACDVSEGRLTRARERIKRAGADNVEPRLLVTERDRWIKRQKGKFDRVLVDAPCSGSGAWRRNPDARWRPVDLADLTALQTRILDSAQRLVKPGGRLVYATCSLLPDENEDRVAGFLADHPEFGIVPVGTVWTQVLGTTPPCDGPFLRLTPARHGTDGFFVAILERAAGPLSDPRDQTP
ncbi:MAG: RsmB/NOP family class I SAM-dependent RNA methyltransferase [Inquilinaceae bacterium]